MNTTWVRIAIAMIVTVVWAISYAVSIVNHHYHPPAEINGVMLLVAGFFFATGIREQAHQISEREHDDVRQMIEEELRHHDQEGKRASQAE